MDSSQSWRRVSSYSDSPAYVPGHREGKGLVQAHPAHPRNSESIQTPQNPGLGGNCGERETTLCWCQGSISAQLMPCGNIFWILQVILMLQEKLKI